MGTLSTAAATAATNAARDAAINAVAARTNGGSLRIYGGTAPADANAALSGNTLLAQLPLSATAFGAAVNGVVTANAITTDTAADATGTPTFFRLHASGGAAEYQGTAGASGQELNLADLTGGQIIAGAPVSVSSLTLTTTASFVAG